MKVHVQGLDKLERHLQELQKRVQAASQEEDVALSELLPSSFMERYTRFGTLDEMIETYGGIESPEDLSSEQWSQFVASRSQFDSWTSMLNAAAQRRLQAKIGL